MTNQRIGQDAPANLVPWGADAAPEKLTWPEQCLFENIDERHRGPEDSSPSPFVAHNPAAAHVAAQVAAARATKANGHTPEIRCHQEARYRRMQVLEAAKALPDEERVQIALESAFGADVVLAGERVLLRAIAARDPEKIRALVAELAAVVGPGPESTLDDRDRVLGVGAAVSALQTELIDDVSADGVLDKDHTPAAARAKQAIDAAVRPGVEAFKRRQA